MTVRMLKVLDFQERIGIVTRTVRSAGADLVHFFILFRHRRCNEENEHQKSAKNTDFC